MLITRGMNIYSDFVLSGWGWGGGGQFQKAKLGFYSCGGLLGVCLDGLFCEWIARQCLWKGRGVAWPLV